MAEAHEILYWLSGGAANTDPDAALGGARSTVQQTGFQLRDTSAPFPGVTILDGSVTDADGPVTFVSLDDSLPDVRVRTDTPSLEVAIVVSSGTVTEYTKAGPSTGASRSRHRLTCVFSTLSANVPDSGIAVYTTPDNNLLRGILEADLLTGVTLYRCFYLQNTSADTLTDHQLWMQFVSDGLVTVEVGIDPIGADGVAQTIVDEETEPVGVTWGGSTDQFTLTSGQVHAVWVRYIFPTMSSLETRMTAGFVYGSILNDPVGQGIFANDMFFELLEDDATDSVTFAEVVDGVNEDLMIVEEEATITDEATASRVLYGDIVDSFALSDTAAAHQQMISDIVDGVIFDDTPASQGIFNAALVDAIAFFDEATTIGGQREGWTLNLDTNAVSRYLWGPFTSFARFEGRHYAVTNDGVFLLEGGTDDGEEIDAFVLLGLTDLGEEFKKRIKAAYLGVRSTGDLLLKVVVDEATYIYTVQTQGMDALKRARGTVGLGLYGNYWQFAIENVAGVDFELESVKILPLKPIVDGRRKD